jgi:hypothetical protein
MQSLLLGGSLRLCKSAVLPICRTHVSAGSLIPPEPHKQKSPREGAFLFVAERVG